MVKFCACHLGVYLCCGDIRVTKNLAHALYRHTILQGCKSGILFFTIENAAYICIFHIKNIEARPQHNIYLYICTKFGL